MQQLNRILQIFLFHLGRRVVNRLPMPVVIVMTVVVIVLLLVLPYLPDWTASISSFRPG